MACKATACYMSVWNSFQLLIVVQSLTFPFPQRLWQVLLHRHLSEVLPSLLEAALLYGSMAHLHERISVPMRFSAYLLEVPAKDIVLDGTELSLVSN